MDLQSSWEKALKFTEVIRPRVLPLSTYGPTALPYIFLAESAIHASDTVVRKGEVIVEKPAIILPSGLPQFEGFDSEDTPLDQNLLTQFLLIRGVQFPSLRYDNKTHQLDLHEGRLSQAIEQYRRQLEHGENISTGLVIGPEDTWPFSILIFTASQVLRQSEGDFKKLWDEYRRKHEAE